MLTNGLDNTAIVNGFVNEDQVSEDEKVGNPTSRQLHNQS